MSEAPPKDIVGSRSWRLKGKRIALCVTGSVAAIWSPMIARELMRHGADVYPVMSQEAQRMIHPNLLEWATGNRPVTELTGKLEHILLAGSWKGKVDLVLIAPCTANTIGKVASGIEDTPVAAIAGCALGSGIPILMAPAMHESMYRNEVLSENIEKLKGRGVVFVEPVIEEGKAKMASVDEIVDETLYLLSIKDLVGLRVLVTAGPTREYIDPIRFITNKSSGRMGIALAHEAVLRGGDVTLICGPSSLPLPRRVKTKKVETTDEMYDAVSSAIRSSHYDVVIAAAAPSDFKPSQKFDYKLPSQIEELDLKLRPTSKVIEVVKKLSPSTFLVAFKGEYGIKGVEVASKAEVLFRRSSADMVVVNDLAQEGAGFEVETNEVYVVKHGGGIVHIPLTHKLELASKIWDEIVDALPKILHRASAL